jgi:hypothetical protein
MTSVRLRLRSTESAALGASSIYSFLRVASRTTSGGATPISEQLRIGSADSAGDFFRGYIDGGGK